MSSRICYAFPVLVFAIALAHAQQAASLSPSQPQTSDQDMQQGASRDMSAMSSESSVHVMHSMEGHHMDMGPHMKMTGLRAPKPGDEARAEKVVEAARRVMQKYEDYRTALADDFHIFHPEIPQKMYHFTNYKYAFEATYEFNPERPTSLLYEKHGDGYTLVGVMYTAPKRFTEDDLDQRIPLSIAQWHEHVNLCVPPSGRKREVLGPNPRFGLRGSISTKEECDANGGTFHPLIFNWMVHVYPLEKTEAQIWAVDRGHEHSHMD
jgi:hypothetical protein